MDENTAPGLTPAQRKALKAQAHHLKPVVMIGDAGLTDAVIAEADRALRIHELIKIRVFGDDRAAREALMAQLCAGLGCAPVQSIGKLLVVYRPHGDDDEAADAQKAGKRARRGPHRPKKAAGASAEARRGAKTAAGVGARSGARKSATGSSAGRKTAAASGASRKSATGSGASRKTATGSGVGRKTATGSGVGRKTATGSGAGAGAGRKTAAGAARGTSPAATTRGTGAKRPATRAPARQAIGTRGSAAPGKRSLSEKTAGKRTDLSSTAKPPARRGRPSQATQGPQHLQGKPGPRTGGRRNRAKGGG